MQGPHYEKLSLCVTGDLGTEALSELLHYMFACPEQLASRQHSSACHRAQRTAGLAFPAPNPSLRRFQSPLLPGRWPQQGTTAAPRPPLLL